MPFTTITAVKAWLGVTSSTDDVLLTSLIKQLSFAMLNYTNRPCFVRATYNELQSGVGNKSLTLRNWPVLMVSSLMVETLTIPARPSIGQSGFALSTWDGSGSGNPQEITLQGYFFCRGQNNIAITYEAGYCILNEAQTVPALSTYTIIPNQPYGNFSQDDGVTYANGTALIKVSSSPAAGQYTVSSIGVYTFAAADSAAAVLISYSYTPADIEEACIEWVGERYRYKQRIGQTSQSIGGQTTSAYSLKMPEHIQTLLNAYEKGFPL